MSGPGFAPLSPATPARRTPADHEAIRAELERLQSNGVIRPADVVEAAREEASPLHGLFNWDDTEAAHQYRLLQARKVLQVYVTVEEAGGTNVRAFVSLTQDRTKEGGGYRSMVDVLSDDALRAQLLQDAFVNLKNLRKKYQNLQQLAKVWAAVDEAEAQERQADAA